MDPTTLTVPRGPHGVDYAAFLRSTLATQAHSLAAYVLTAADGSAAPEQVWLKKAGPLNARWPYAVLGALAGLVRLEALRPVPNPGGTVAIQTEARRLAELHSLGLRVPPVLAVADGGLLIRHLGRTGAPTKSLADEMHHAAIDTPHTVLPLWQQGLDAIGLVHDKGACLSQAFARNLVRCPDGVVGYIDFEDDPAAALPLAQCQLRDLLCYAHSTALYLEDTGALQAANHAWATWTAQRPPAMRLLLQTSLRRMRWMRHLPTQRTLGRDLQRARMAYALMATTG